MLKENTPVPVSVKLGCADQVLTRYSCRVDVWIIAEDGRGDDTVEPVIGTERADSGEPEEGSGRSGSQAPRLHGSQGALAAYDCKGEDGERVSKAGKINEQRENAWLQRSSGEGEQEETRRSLISASTRGHRFERDRWLPKATLSKCMKEDIPIQKTQFS